MVLVKKPLAIVFGMLLCLSVFAGCGGAPSSADGGTIMSNDESATPSLEMDTAASDQPAPDASSTVPPQETQKPVIKLAAMKGPTSMGLAKLLSDNEAGLNKNQYDFIMTGTADEIVAKIAKGELDAAAVPCNLASVLYSKTQGGISVAAINTLGVLYIAETGENISSLDDLKGKTLYATGKGTTPEFTLNYILSSNGIDPQKDITIEYKSEATEVAAMLADGTAELALLPEPYLTTAKAKNEKLRTAIDLTEQWDNLQNGSALVTGVVIFRKQFVNENPQAASAFLDEYRASTDYINSNVDEASKLVEKYGIAPANVAQIAIPNCNITFIEGDEMQGKIHGYLDVLYQQDPKSVGGTMPDDAFYFKR